MGAVTYPEPAVADEINTHFIPLQINVTEPSAAPIVQRFRQVWTPDLRVLASDGYELYSWNGYLPPFEFLPQLMVPHAHAHMRMQNNETAVDIYYDALSRFPTSHFAPEAQYFIAVAKYKGSQEPSDLVDTWKLLQSRYPYSIWRVKQSQTEQSVAW